MTAPMKAAFPGMPDAVLDLLAGGDLALELPDWDTRFDDAYGELPGVPMPWRAERAWKVVLAAYDRATAGQMEDVL